MAQKEFYVVIKRDDKRLSRHYSVQSAELEAKRLAQKCGDAFFVLSVIEGYKRGEDKPKRVKTTKSYTFKSFIRNILVKVLKALG